MPNREASLFRTDLENVNPKDLELSFAAEEEISQIVKSDLGRAIAQFKPESLKALEDLFFRSKNIILSGSDRLKDLLGKDPSALDAVDKIIDDSERLLGRASLFDNLQYDDVSEQWHFKDRQSIKELQQTLKYFGFDSNKSADVDMFLKKAPEYAAVVLTIALKSLEESISLIEKMMSK